MSGPYKLTYFNFTALAEPIRWIFKVKNVDFEDERIEMADWPNHKSRFPQGQVPSLVIEDGKELTQSNAIGRFLGKKFGLVTNDPYLDFLGDQVVDLLVDGRLQWRNTFLMEKDAEKKEEARKNLVETICPKVLKQLNDIVSSTEGDYISGDKLTWADLFLANWLSIWTKSLSTDLVADFPALKKQWETVLDLPEIKKWIAERPQTMI